MDKINEMLELKLRPTAKRATEMVAPFLLFNSVLAPLEVGIVRE